MDFGVEARERLRQLTELRDAFKRQGALMQFVDVEGLVRDCIRDSSLKSILTEPKSIKAVWYCLCNNNVNRDSLIKLLYDYFVVRNKMAEKDALKLISIVLFLGGVDFQLNDIGSPVGSSGNFNNGSLPVDGQYGGGSVKTKVKNKWKVPIILSVIVLLVVVLVARSNKEHGTRIAKEELCRDYKGTIVTGENKKTCNLSISWSQGFDNNVFAIAVNNIYEQNDKKTYSGNLEGTMLYLKDEANKKVKLEVTKNDNGKVERLQGKSVNSENEEQWNFVPKN